MSKINVFLMFKKENSVNLFKEILERENIEIVGYCNHDFDAIKTIGSCKIKPDIVLLDANWPSPLSHFTGINLLREFLQLKSLLVIAITTHFEPRTISLFQENGAHGYFYRNSSVQLIIQCIQNVYMGKNHFCQTEG